MMNKESKLPVRHPILTKHLEETEKLTARQSYEMYLRDDLASQMGRKPMASGRYRNIFSAFKNKEILHLKQLAIYFDDDLISIDVMAQVLADVFSSDNVKRRQWALSFLASNSGGKLFEQILLVTKGSS